MSIGRVLSRINGKGYRAYRELQGASEIVDGVRVRVVRVQSDPFAPPSVARLEASLPPSLPEWALEEPVPLSDFLYRKMHVLLRKAAVKIGEGRSGFLGIPRPGPVMLRRSGLEVHGRRLVARVWVGLPSRRRRVLADAARELLLQKLPRTLLKALRALASEQDSLRRHITAWQVQEDLRKSLPRHKLVAFVGDGSILPRRCGGCEEPLPNAVPFESPPSLRVEVETRHGPVTGMGIRRGVTVVAGTAFHGKTTLLEAIQYGIYNHIPGDGRERVVSLRSTVKVRAEDGRRVACVDISTFIHSLPDNRDTYCFTTENASGATSMAAAIQEAVEAGAQLILVDEDTSATNLLFYDERAEPLLRRKTVTTISEQASSIASKASLVVVSSGTAPLIASATTVVVMEDYRPRDATTESKKILEGYQPPQQRYKPPRHRRLELTPRLVKPRLKGRWLTARGLSQPFDLGFNEQLVEEGQLRLLVALSPRLHELRGMTMREIVLHIDSLIAKGFKALLGEEPDPGYSEVRGIDVAMTINRLPGIRMTQQ
jgi:hypothetical protein